MNPTKIDPNTVSEIALAEEMLRIWGRDAALNASNNACTEAFMGDEEAARKWRRIMILIIEASKSYIKAPG